MACRGGVLRFGSAQAGTCRAPAAHLATAGTGGSGRGFADRGPDRPDVPGRHPDLYPPDYQPRDIPGAAQGCFGCVACCYNATEPPPALLQHADMHNLRALRLQTWGPTTRTASPRRAEIQTSCPLAIPHQVGGGSCSCTLVSGTSPRIAANAARLLLISSITLLCLPLLPGAAPNSRSLLQMSSHHLSTFQTCLSHPCQAGAPTWGRLLAA